MTSDEGQLSWSVEFLDSLITELSSRSIQVGVDDVLRLQVILNSLPLTLSRSQMKDRLRPILITNQEEQARFDDAFDAVYNEAPIHAKLASLRAQGFSIPADKKLAILQKCRDLHPATRNEEINALIEEAAGHRVDDDPNLRYIAFWPTFLVIRLALAFGLFLAITQTTVWQEPQNPLRANLKEEPSPEKIKKTPENTHPLGPVEPGHIIEPILFQIESHPKATPQPPTRIVENGLQRYPNLLVGGLFLFAAGAMLAEFIRRRKIKAAARQALSEGSPFHWDVNLTASDSWPTYERPEVWTIARLLRKRSIAGSGVIDVRRTIRDTTLNGGFISLRYRPATHHVDHLVLIEKQSRRDHCARLFADLADSLSANGVQSEVLTYSGDPRVCLRENGDRILLSTLALTHHERRLLIFGSGRRFVQVTTGELDYWTAAFHRWPERLLVSPIPKAAWDWTEATILPGIVPVSGASLKDLTAGSFSLSAGQEPRAREVLTEEDRAISTADKESLRTYLGRPELYKWLCACAVYPELHYDLTMWLGQRIANATYEECVRLFALPWFREGSIPNPKRAMLLDSTSDADLREVNRLVSEALEATDKPPVGSRAWRQFQLEFALQQWVANRDRDSKKALDDAAAHSHPKDVQRNAILQELMKRTKLDFVLTDRVKKLLYRHGIRSYGFHQGLAFITSLMLTGVLVGVLSAYRAERVIESQPSIEQIADFPISPNKITIGEVNATEWRGVELQFVNGTNAPFRVSTIKLDREQSKPLIVDKQVIYDINGGKLSANGGKLKISMISLNNGLQTCQISVKSNGPSFQPFRGNITLTFDRPTPSTKLVIECTPRKVVDVFNEDLVTLCGRLFAQTDSERKKAAADLQASRWRNHPDTVPALLKLATERYSNQNGVYNVLAVLLELDAKAVRPSVAQVRTLCTKLDGDPSRTRSMVLAKRLRDRYFSNYKFPSETVAPWVTGRWISVDGLAEMRFTDSGGFAYEDNVGYEWTGSYTLTSTTIEVSGQDPIDGEPYNWTITFTRDQSTLNRGQDFKRESKSGTDSSSSPAPPSWILGQWSSNSLVRSVVFNADWKLEYNSSDGSLTGTYALSGEKLTLTLTTTSGRNVTLSGSANSRQVSFDGVIFRRIQNPLSQFTVVPDWLVGSWVHEQRGTVYQFKSDGKYIRQDRRSEEVGAEGTFTISGSDIFLNNSATPNFVVDSNRESMRLGSAIYRKAGAAGSPAAQQRISNVMADILVNGRSELTMSGAGKLFLRASSFTDNTPQMNFRFEFNADGEDHILSGQIGSTSGEDRVTFDGAILVVPNVQISSPNETTVILTFTVMHKGSVSQITITTRKDK